MPHLFSFASNTNDDVPLDLSTNDLPTKRSRRPSLLRKNPLRAFRRHHGEPGTAEEEEVAVPQTAPPQMTDIPDYFLTRRPSLPDEAAIKRVIPSLPRPQTFRRQQSEQRDRLLPLDTSASERRAVSVDPRKSRGMSAAAPGRPQSPKPVPPPATSAPNVLAADRDNGLPLISPKSLESRPGNESVTKLPPLEVPDATNEAPLTDREGRGQFLETSSLQEEYEQRWILNLSMQFRDKSNREKFFVTYAERPNKWRRVTVSLDYRNAPPDSLEADLSTLVYQRDKSLRVYEAIRESLPDIQYYDTVTNLKLETTPEDGQLHVHVREDANETIEFPAISLFDHVRRPRFNENSIQLDSHLSGFVYKVRLGTRVLIKKEIPGPDTVDEFLYEVNALDSLIGCDHVVQLEGLVTDDRGEVVKGLLLSYAAQGAMVDMIFDFRGTSSMSWHRREKWAKQIVSGLADIHEAGFVQGDFTLSNIVIDEDDNALIIDINRRGCPVGWEPPELSRFIDSGQRISMCIGVKTDLYQLGMVLWALAEEVDEPERVERPLPPVFEEIPAYYRNIVATCLRERPQGRASAKDLLRYFPPSAGVPPADRTASVGFCSDLQMSDHTSSSKAHRSDKEYIDPDMAVTIDDVKQRRIPEGDLPHFDTTDQVAYFDPESNPASTTYPFESSGSWIVGRRRSRGRSPVSSNRRRRTSPYGRSLSLSSATSLSEDSPRRHRAPSGGAVNDKASWSGESDVLRARLPPANAIDLAHVDSGFDDSLIKELESTQIEETSALAAESESTPMPSARSSTAACVLGQSSVQTPSRRARDKHDQSPRLSLEAVEQDEEGLKSTIHDANDRDEMASKVDAVGTGVRDTGLG
ncbi:unnamed protein product [Zymoseptoria tritici ST99CH_1A5]|uniref:Protein kinase domain-containing protein n=3 Tax=Zymoseptoria tritici TaxID=1047171 RepID=A0A2H1GHR5_ZYMTR|nr:unnamed protein product [Zymoseptoria tritici ST99CH_1E4]SMY24869.1 unnamed protein product [Zymoseptoria tritici ST99CH_1A5]